MNDTWTTKDGRKIKISDMTTQHIMNTINMLKRKIDNAEEESPIPFEDMADTNDSLGLFAVWIIIFEDELAKRQDECELVCI